MTETPRTRLSLKREAAPKLEERLHKVLAEAGLGSRRSLEERIAQGQVRVNQEVAQVGCVVKSGDRIDIDGRGFVASARSEPPRILIYHKPEGELTTRDDPEGRPTVFEHLPVIKGSRWIAVGRLDINTTGLLLLTTDGELANALMHPSREVLREYVCRIHGEVGDEVMKQLQRGVELEDGPARFDGIERIGSSDSHAWFKVTLHEGRNREVRRLWDAVGFQVSRLKRVRYGTIELPRLLRRGQHQELPPEQVEEIRQTLELAPVSASLTLQPVIGQRRAKSSEYRPAPREQKAWTQGGYGDEGRELRAFDNVREDRPGKPRRGKPGKPRRGGANKGPKPASDNYGNTLTAPAGQPRGRQAGNKRRGAAPGFENPQEFRSWYVPDGVHTTSPNARRPTARDGRPAGKPGGRAAGPRDGSGRGRGGPGGPGGRGPGSSGPAPACRRRRPPRSSPAGPRRRQSLRCRDRIWPDTPHP